MFSIRNKPSWWLPEREATSEDDFVNRRAFISKAGSVVAIAPWLSAANVLAQEAGKGTPYRTTLPKTPTGDCYPARRNEAYKLDRPLTPESVSAIYNNFYEFTTDKSRVWKMADVLKLRPWTVEVGGMVKAPKTWDIDDLVRKLPLEERLCRFRCVEAWAMAVPWTGIPFKAFLDLVEPSASAKYVRMETLADPKIMPGLKSGYPWPYHEALTIKEAANELAMLVTGVYGHELPKQHGGPIRLITPWKYGFKSIKSIIKITFTDKRPKTFWNVAVPKEYGFYANINPEVPHPRWSQASERLIGTGERRPTKLYNGYGEQVADLYRGLTDHFF